MARRGHSSDDPLKWVMHNRSRPDRGRAAGAWVAGLAEDLLSQRDKLAAAADRIAPAVDEEFRRHCRVADVSGDGVLIHVDEPGLLSPFRLRWSPVLAGKLGGGRKRGRQRVFFEFGRSGAEISL